MEVLTDTYILEVGNQCLVDSISDKGLGTDHEPAEPIAAKQCVITHVTTARSACSN